MDMLRPPYACPAPSFLHAVTPDSRFAPTPTLLSLRLLQLKEKAERYSKGQEDAATLEARLAQRGDIMERQHTTLKALQLQHCTALNLMGSAANEVEAARDAVAGKIAKQDATAADLEELGGALGELESQWEGVAAALVAVAAAAAAAEKEAAAAAAAAANAAADREREAAAAIAAAVESEREAAAAAAAAAVQMAQQGRVTASTQTCLVDLSSMDEAAIDGAPALETEIGTTTCAPVANLIAASSAAAGERGVKANGVEVPITEGHIDFPQACGRNAVSNLISAREAAAAALKAVAAAQAAAIAVAAAAGARGAAAAISINAAIATGSGAGGSRDDATEGAVTEILMEHLGGLQVLLKEGKRACQYLVIHNVLSMLYALQMKCKIQLPCSTLQGGGHAA